MEKNSLITLIVYVYLITNVLAFRYRLAIKTNIFGISLKLTTQVVKFYFYLRLIVSIRIYHTYTPNLPVVSLDCDIDILPIELAFKHISSTGDTGEPLFLELAYHFRSCSINRYSEKLRNLNLRKQHCRKRKKQR